MRCNANGGPAASKCSVAAGQTVTVEMHQHASRACTEEAIGGAHYGPVLVYMSKVKDAASADGSDPFFKIFQDTWGKASATSQGSDDFWGTKDLNANCGKMDVKIPMNLAPGDYLLRAEAIALHAAGSAGGAQFYITCYQVTVTGGGSSNPAGVTFPGAYKASDPGVQINIYQQMSEYVAPGPAVIPGGSEAVAGKVGSVAAPTGGASAPAATSSSQKAPASTLVTSVKPVTPVAEPTPTKAAVSSKAATSVKSSSTSAAGTGAGCTAVAKYQQCGGSGFKGCTTCAAGATCKVQNAYYSQCL
ncbi:glycosyl hydrolase family 61-domain-containing protein [Massariosphaeria phaeospora]|uniref:AA9 family lytic polysaccharide monooxygenase n=1 Tax=Massariosphaeria phaeospora TaxID=100035 RepID=A0A7C8MBQ3_9PLEO|nr:glycosyl hydrolase family 61-domain-containing protein [Massariosphaeria phaeospora]